MKRLSETAGSANTETRLELVQEHVRAENRHDLEDIMETFGGSPRYDDAPWKVAWQMLAQTMGGKP